jgi:LuxR family maltose regulon positive regulatory protein
MRSRIFHSGPTFSHENQAYLERVRLDQLLEDALQKPLVTISAGAGYGKTRAVYSFLRKYDIVTTWIQLSERDNVGTRFWENFLYAVTLYDSCLAKRLGEIGFPETEDQFSKYFSIPEEVIAQKERSVTVFDEFHLIQDESVLRFIKRSVQSPMPKMTTILISRAEPDIDTISLLSKGLVAHLNEDDLRFTEEETARYFQLLSIPLSSQSVSNIHSDTAGWALGLHLIGLSLTKAPSREREARAAMKLNIFKMIENEVFLVISERLQRFLIRLSLIDRLSTDLISVLAGDETLVDEIKVLSSFVRYDIYLHAYVIHHLFLDYLRQRQNILTEEERRDTYLKAARWCDENDYKMDAISYYDKAGEYETILRIVSHFPQQIPFNQAKFVLDIYDKAPADSLEQFASYHPQRARLLLSMERYAEVRAEVESCIEKYSALPNSDFNNRVLYGAYLALGVIGYETLPQTDRCCFDVPWEKADHYYRLSPYGESSSMSSVGLDAWASRVGTSRSGAMEEYIETLTRGVPYVVNILNGCMYGLDDLARGELLFYKGDLKPAENVLKQAFFKAETRSQHEVRNRALFYLMRIGIAQGNFQGLQGVLKDLEAQLKMNDYQARFITYDVVAGWCYSVLGQPHLVADWLKGDFAQESLAIFKVNFRNIIKVKFQYANRHYHELLPFLEGEKGTLSTLLFAKLGRKALEAVCHYQLKDKDAALSALREAYDLAESNNLTMPFIELGKDMRTLTAAAMKDKKCDIPPQWLEMINRKAATYAKRRAFIISEYKRANNLGNDVPLSPREMDILHDLSHGLSRPEIAANHGLSINTVKMVLNAIYTKLNADSVTDVIRIALERQLIK